MNTFLVIAICALQNSEGAVLRQRRDYRNNWGDNIFQHYAYGEKDRLASFPTAETESDPAIGDDLNNLVNDEDNSGSGKRQRGLSSLLYSMCLKECKRSFGTHEHCHSPCSKFAMSFKTDNGGCVSPECLPGQNRDIKQDQRQKTDEIDESLMEELVKFLEEYFDQNSLRESDPAIGDDLNNLVNDEDNSGSGTSRQKRNLLTDLIQPHMDEMWVDKTEEEIKEDREAYEWMQSVGWENIKPVLQRLIDEMRAERERETDPEKIWIQDIGLKAWTDVLEGGEPFIRWLLIESKKLLRQKMESKDSQNQAQKQALALFGASTFNTADDGGCVSLECSRGKNRDVKQDRRQKTDETDENLKEALERLIEEYLHQKSQDEDGQA